MTSDKMQALSSMTTRQKATAGVVAVVVLILLWQLSSMFGGGSPTPAKTTAAKTAAMKPGTPSGNAGGMQPQNAPKAIEIVQGPPPVTQREAELMALQQETQEKYLKALNELQVLKVTREIAVTNKDISSARLAKVVSEKKIVDLLTPPAPPPTSEAINKSFPVQQTVVTNLGDQEVKYTVVSIAQLQYRWGAVLGYKGNVFNVHVGDVLPPDGSVVDSIAKDAVTLEKDGVKKKLSLMPTI